MNGEAEEIGEGALEAAWTQVLENWGDDSAHKRFIALAGTLGRLADAGARYRQERDRAEDPRRRSEAARQIERLFTTALGTLEPLQPTDYRNARRGLLVAAIVLTVLMLAFAALLLSHVVR